jgi:imidazole glycerol-phosphate synthase subunit HisF
MKVRIIPSILTDGQTVVKGTQFNNWRTVGMAQATAQLFGRRDVDELMFLDVMASERRSSIPESLVSSFTEILNVPFSIGGGVSSLGIATNYLSAGAEKVVIGRAALATPSLVSEVAEKFGSQAVVVAIDVLDFKQGVIATNCGKDQVTNSVIEWAKELESLGAGEILLQSVPRDGEMQGMDYEAISQVSANVNLPLIASSGAGSLNDCELAVRNGASAVAIGALFQFTEVTPKQVRNYLDERGIKVRAS